MVRLTLSTSAVVGVATATVLSGVAVITVTHSGCQDPGSYEAHDGVVELIGGCVQPGDVDVTPQDAPAQLPQLAPADLPADDTEVAP